MNLFDLKIAKSTTFTIPLKVEPVDDPCVDKSYAFSILEPALAYPLIPVELEVVGGISPYTWELVSAGCELDSTVTIGTMNTITALYSTGDRNIHYTVTDACGTVLNGAVVLDDDDLSIGCLSGDCAAAPELLLTGTVVDVEVGMQYIASGGIPPYRYRLEGGLVDGTGTIISFEWLPPAQLTSVIRVIDACGNSYALDLELLVGSCTDLEFSITVNDVMSSEGCRGVGIGSKFTVLTGHPIKPLTWTTPTATINASTGILEGVGLCNFVVTCTDACGNEATWQHRLLGCGESDAFIYGANPLENGIYSVVTGGVATIALSCGDILWRSGNTVGIGNLEDCCSAQLAATTEDSATSFVERSGVCCPNSSPCNSDHINKELPDISISGDEDVQVGNYYTGSGGAGEISYTFSGGSIDSETGRILSIGNCSDYGGVAVATVSATDDCGQVASMDVRLPDGYWVQTGDQAYSAPESDSDNYVCCGSSMYCGGYVSGTCYSYPDTISGGSRTIHRVHARCGSWCVDGHWYPCTSSVGKAAPGDFGDYCFLNDCYPISTSGSGTFCRAYMGREYFYTWGCP